MLNIIDFINALTDLLILRGAHGRVRSDSVAKSIAKAVREWVVAVGAETAFIAQAARGRRAIARASTL